MTQEYLNNLFENYPDVDTIYWTADSTAFKSIEDAKAYGKKLGTLDIQKVERGGQLADAVAADVTEKTLGETTGAYIDDTPVNEFVDEVADEVNNTEELPEPTPYDNMTVAALKALCVERTIPMNGATRKDALIALLVAADAAN